MRSLPSVCAVAIVIALTGCAVGPDYHAPKMKVPDGFAAGSGAPVATAAGNAAVDPTQWWRALNDPQLESLIDRAMRANTSLEIALTRLQEARTFETVVVGHALRAAARASVS